MTKEARRIANLNPTEPIRPTTNRIELEAHMVARPKLPETGFLLDWLSGGEGCQRNIQGFSLRFEALI